MSVCAFVLGGFAQSVPAPAAKGPVPAAHGTNAVETLAHKAARTFPRSATSADGFVEVLAADVPGDPVGFRLPLLRFTTQLVGELEHAYGLEMPRTEGRGLVIHALDGSTNDIRVITRVVRRDGHVLTRLWLPSPGYTNLDALRFEIVKAYFRGWIDRHRPAGATEVADELPTWFAYGAMSARSIDAVHNEARVVLELANEHRLPPFPKFAQEMKLASPQDALLADFLVGWLKERHAFSSVLDRLAAGETWKSLDFPALLTGVTSEAEQKQAFEARLTRLSRTALAPGRTTPWDLKNFRAQLTLDLAPFAGEKKIASPVCTFREAIARRETEPEAVRKAALQKLRDLPFYAMRRGPELEAACESYSSFLVMLSRGAQAEKLGALLDAADAKLQEAVDKATPKPAPQTPEKKSQDENGKNDNR